MLYKDASNQKSNHQHLSTIQSSNLCVTPETRVLTKAGHIPICNLVGTKMSMWNGDAWSKVDIVQTGIQQLLMTISLSNGSQLTCTPYHKFIIHDSYTNKWPLVNAKCIDARDLQPE